VIPQMELVFKLFYAKKSSMGDRDDACLNTDLQGMIRR
jgi:hypothetical protein